MIIKTYTTGNMKEAITRATYELGRDAVIINQQRIKVGKWYNPFKKTKLQVTFALEEKTSPKTVVKKPKRTIGPERTIEPKNKEEKTYEKRYSIKELIEKNPMFKNVNDRIKGQILGYLKLSMKDETDFSSEEIVDFMKIAFRDNCFEKKVKFRKINVFVGPTGVGKTTTIAKIAAHESLVNKRKVGLLTIDTYRIGAVEQLRTYSEILKLPFEVAHGASEMEEKLENLKDCDMILIDTLGTSQRNMEKLNDINLYLENIKHKTNNFLVVSVSTDIETTNSIFEKYKFLDYNGLILTKFDEVTNFNNLWNIIEHNEYPVQYFCHGQDVPDDIEIGTLENLIAYSEEIYEDE